MPERALLASPMATNILVGGAAIMLGIGGPAVEALTGQGVEPGEIAKFGVAGLLCIVCLLLINSWRAGSRETATQASKASERHAKQLETVLATSDKRAEKMVTQLVDELKASREHQLTLSKSQAKRDQEISTSMFAFGSKLEDSTTAICNLAELIERSTKRSGADDAPAPPAP